MVSGFEMVTGGSLKDDTKTDCSPVIADLLQRFRVYSLQIKHCSILIDNISSILAAVLYMTTIKAISLRPAFVDESGASSKVLTGAITSSFHVVD